MPDLSFEVDDTALFRKICGFKDTNLKNIEKYLPVKMSCRGNTIMLTGDDIAVEGANKILHLMSDFLHEKNEGYEFDQHDIRYIIQLIKEGHSVSHNDLNKIKITIPESGKTIFPKSINQAHYLAEISKKSIVFGIGPAGTGKTYLAVASAVNEFVRGSVKKIMLTRPAVEAGESLGYLPGDFMQKVNPYLRPLYDSLFDVLSFEKVTKLIESNTIEIAPLAYMRGRTLNNAFIILDEAQNTTISQMKMFLTRLGTNSKMVLSGDITQIDLEKPKKSGLLNASRMLRNIKEISFVEFSRDDICRHPIVEKIVNAYEQEEEK